MSVDETDLRTQIESEFNKSAQAESSAPAVEKPAAAAPAATEKPAAVAGVGAAPARDDKGRFAASAEKPPSAVQAKPAAADPAVAAKPVDETHAPAAVAVVAKPGEPPAAAAEPPKAHAPPIGWKADDKAKWHELPTWAQAAIAQREVDAHKQISKQDDERSFGREMQRVIQPYLAQIAAVGGTPAGTVQSMLNTAYILTTGAPEAKRSALLQVARQYGVNLISQVSPASNGASQQPQDIQALIQQQVENRFQAMTVQQNQAQTQAAHQAALQTIEAFSADPANEYFDAVKEYCAALLQSRLAPDLKTAYDMACRAHPEVCTTLQARNRVLEDQKRAEDEKRRVEIAKSKGLSLVGVPGSASVPNAQKPASDLKTEIRNNLNAARAAV